jgi:hypothetical protein
MAALSMLVVTLACATSWTSAALADRPAAPVAALPDEPVDLVQVDGDRVYHLDEAAGLLIYDVSDADHPRLVGRHAIVGYPLGVVARGGVATIVMRSSDARSGGASAPGPALVRTIDVRDPAQPRVLGESSVEGDVRDARATTDALYVLSESRSSERSQVLVTALRLDGADATPVRVLRRDGSAGSIRAIGDRVIVAHADARKPGTHVDVLVDSPRDGLTLRGSVDLEATIGYGDRDVSSRMDARDLAHVRVLGCRTVFCSTDDALDVATVDATVATRPRVVSSRVVRSPGLSLAVRFDGSRLYMSRRGWLSLGMPSTPVSIFDLDAPSSQDGARQLVDGVVWNLIPAGPKLLVVGTRGETDATHERVFVDELDVRNVRHSRFAADALVGDDWTSSTALTSSQAIAVRGDLIAVPFRSAAMTSGRVRSGVALLRSTESGVRPLGRVDVDGYVTRVLFVRGRLLAVTDTGLWSFDIDGLRAPRVARIIAPPPHDGGQARALESPRR